MAAEKAQSVVGRLSTANGVVCVFSHDVNFQKSGQDYSSVILCQKTLQSDVNRCLTEMIEQADKSTGVLVQPENAEDMESEEGDEEEDIPERNGTIPKNSRHEVKEPKCKIQRTQEMS